MKHQKIFFEDVEVDQSHYSCQQQANTADMLDLAVVYIKDLQKEVQVNLKVLSYSSLYKTPTSFVKQLIY